MKAKVKARTPHRTVHGVVIVFRDHVYGVWADWRDAEAYAAAHLWGDAREMPLHRVVPVKPRRSERKAKRRT